MKLRILPILAAIILTFSACSPEPYTEYEFMMDTNCSITVYGRKDRDAIQPTFQRMREIDRALDRYNESSEVAEINRNAGISPVEVSEETFRLIARAKELSALTGGAFNPLLGAVSDLWNFDGTVHESLPDSDEIAGLVEVAVIDNLILDEASSTVFLADSSLELDLGAIAKGYASQVAAEHLSSLGVEKAIVNLGGNVYVLGERPDGSPWRVGIQNPDAERGGYFTTVECRDSSVVTSGGYQRYIEVDGVTYHHILDPATGWPCESDLASVSIITEDGTLADALSTACYVLGLEEGRALCERVGVSAIFLTDSGELLRLDC